jgi:hypothetical protein
VCARFNKSTSILLGIWLQTRHFYSYQNLSNGVVGILITLALDIIPYLSITKIFGCKSYVHVDAALRRKLDDKAWEGINVGTSCDSPAWLIYNPTTKRTVASRSVIFYECELLSFFPNHVHVTGSILPFHEPTNLAEAIYDGRKKTTRPPPQDASNNDSGDDLHGDSAPTIMETFLTPEILQPDDVVAWGATSTHSTPYDHSSATQRERIPISTSPATHDQPHVHSDTMAAATPPAGESIETAVTSTPTNDQHL